MYQSKLYVDLDTKDVLSRITEEANQPFAALEEEITEEGMITFVLDAKEFVDSFERELRNSRRVTAVERLEENRLLVTKAASGALPIIRENHGKLNGIDLVNGTRRIFSVLTFHRGDIKEIFDELGTIGSVRLEQLIPIGQPTAVLSERQREAVLLAHQEGYYDWPRKIKATELAEEMGVAHSTYIEHLRKAEEKLITRSLNDYVDAAVSEEERFLEGSDSI
jgi:predicted DNA binding protein